MTNLVSRFDINLSTERFAYICAERAENTHVEQTTAAVAAVVSGGDY